MNKKPIPESVLRRINKCLALSKSDNKGEAANALRQAHALMKKYDITAEEAAISEVIEGKTEKTINRSHHANALVDIVRKVFQVYPLSNGLGQVIFIGTPANVQIAIYVFELLWRQIKRDRKTYLSSLPSMISKTRKTKLADTYCLAWTESVEEKVKDLFKPLETPVKSYIEKYKNIETMALKNFDKNVTLDPLFFNTYRRGLEDGKQAQIFVGVSKATASKEVTNETL